MPSSIKLQVEAEVKDAMRARAKPRLGALRLIMAEAKRIEVDERIELDDDRMLVILDKMVKQRRDSLSQFESAGRDDLVAQEQLELDILQEFLPEQLSEEALVKLVDEVVAATGAAGMQDMGKVMGQIKGQVQGQADMGLVGKLVKARLG